MNIHFLNVRDWTIRHKWGLLCTGLALILRLIWIGNFPAQLNPDEAALGYNAYSLLLTGHDEHGVVWPIIFKSFGDYKPGLYVYLSLPFIALGGLSETMVRMPSVIAGSLAVFLLYVCLRLTRAEWPYKFMKEYVATLAAFILAINPWHIFFSRGAWEANVALTGVLLMVTCLLYALKRQVKWLYFAGIAIGSLTFLTYQGAKLATPLTGLALLLAYRKHWKKSIGTPNSILGVVIVLLITSPIIASFFNGQAGRLSVFNVLNYQRPDSYIESQFVIPTGLPADSLYLKLFESEFVSTLRGVILRYANTMSPRFLFAEGDWEHPIMAVKYLGQFYWLDVLFLIIGIIYAIKSQSAWWKFIILWSLFAPIPGALSRDPVNSVRSLSLVIPFSALIGLGFCHTTWLIRRINKRAASIFLSLILVAYSISLGYFLDYYFVVNPQKITKAEYYGYKQLVTALAPYRARHQPIFMSQSYAQPYIYFLFYEKYDPSLYQQVHSFTPSSSGDVGLVDRVDDYMHFQDIVWDAVKQMKGHVYVADPVTTIHPSESSDSNLFVAQTIETPTHHGVFRIVEIKP